MVNQQKFDLIHTHTPRSAMLGKIAARLAGVPLVHHVHGHTATEVGRNWRTWLSAQTERFSLSQAAAVIAVSPSAAQYIHNWGVPQERIHFVRNGVPGRKQLAHRPTPQGVWTLGMVALFRPRKGLEVLLETLAILRSRRLPVKLRVVGGFETPLYEAAAKLRAEELGITDQIQWRGFRQNMDAELDAIDLSIVPSLLPEGLPLAVVEALASGVPSIGSRVEGITEAIRHGHDGLLVEPNNPQSLAAAITAMIEGKHDWQFLRRNAIASHAQRFSDRSMAVGVANVYRQVLNS